MTYLIIFILGLFVAFMIIMYLTIIKHHLPEIKETKEQKEYKDISNEEVNNNAIDNVMLRSGGSKKRF